MNKPPFSLFSCRSRRTGLAICLSLGVIPFATAACGAGGSGGEQASAVAEAQANKRESLPAATTPSAKVVVGYLALQQALAKDDLAAARSAFGQVRTAAQDAAAINDAALRKRMSDAAQSGEGASDLKAARKAFEPLTRVLLDFTRAQANPTSAALHVAHCPMAFDNAGADWLQLGTAIENPYYGSEMLTCGSLGAEIAPGQKLVAK